MKVIRSLSITVPALMLVSFASFADSAGPRPVPQQQPQQQVAPQPPQGYPPPVQQAGPIPGGQPGYFCGTPCLPPPPLVVVPVPVPIPLPPPIIRPPIYCPPNCGGWNGGGYVGRPGFNGGGYPPPVYVAPGGSGGYIRRMSGSVGCEVQQGNSGEFVVLSAEGDVIYSDKSSAASQNADTMKAYYEKGNTGLCGITNSADKVHSI